MPAPAHPRVSVVIPLFQKAPYIRRALDSVFRQTLEEFEVIVVDDGSTDEAPQVLAAIDDRRLTVHRQEHAGVSAARNAGVSLSRASWVAFLDADDEWRPAFLESTLRIAESMPRVSVVFTNFRDYQTGHPCLVHTPGDGDLVRDYFSAVLRNGGLGMSSSSVLALRSQIESCGGFRAGVQHGEDLDLWARLAWTGDVGYCDETLAVCHTEVEGSASKDLRAATLPYPAFLNTWEEWRAAGRIPGPLRKSSARYANWILARHVMELAHQGLREEARRRLDAALWRNRADPLHWRARIWIWLPAGFLRRARALRGSLNGRFRMSRGDRSRTRGA
ncbi:MAG: glycosyltransferase family 2 protein [Vicinamibacteria bacterium]|nr:glycosyltransferase family 2 protein [Vicinamibacteria bacterium]